MTLEFLRADAAATEGDWVPIASSPMEHLARAAGAICEARDGWNVATSYGDSELEREVAAASVGFADASHLGKVELQAEAGDMALILAGPAGETRPELGRAARAGGAWWAPLTAERALVICDGARLAALRDDLEQAAAEAAGPASVLDLTTAFGALILAGPMARETFARFSAIDLRPTATPVGGLRPGSVARTPGLVIREARDRYLMTFGAALAEYVWTVVADAAESLGGGPIGVDALDSLDDPVAEAAGHA